ncbi:AraC family transcriptional regulator [Dyella monticola]|uniref:AraC family transcriptional regulator n=1 Tax=Dyella monticola TaxID=1927958 RepID=A0A370WRQ5_9GAMM|nr:AraC family transcriptional regulator [Dyella monticola]RDS78790.1 AraC family transcriptional regulator [Dyella monticola]
MSEVAFELREARRTLPAAIEPDARAQAADIPPNVLVHLTEFAARHGIASDGWFAGLGITRPQINEPSLRVSYRQARTVISRALRGLRYPALGLLIGRNETIGSFGLLGLAMMTSRNFGEAMNVGIENHKVCGSLLDVDLAVVDAQHVAVQTWPRFGEIELLPFLCEELFASCLAIARELVGPKITPVRMEFTYPAPSYAAEYITTFQCDVRFGAQHNRIVVDANWLAHPLPGYNPLTSRQALALCHQQLRGTTSADEIVGSVERLLRSRLRDHPRLTEVAHTLHLSERSLRRRLAESGRIFREIHDRVRAERALELLRAGQMSVAEIGIELGFSDPREFRRAFKRWTGMPPQLARRSLP